MDGLSQQKGSDRIGDGGRAETPPSLDYRSRQTGKATVPTSPAQQLLPRAGSPVVPDPIELVSAPRLSHAANFEGPPSCRLTPDAQVGGALQTLKALPSQLTGGGTPCALAAREGSQSQTVQA
jgi:hypothetical protein